MSGVDPVEQVVDELAVATATLLTGLGEVSDANAREPSLLPGWTRGHVLTHLARNAEGGTRLLGWARTGVPSYEYRSVAARAAAIEEGAGRPAAVLVADVRATASAFAAAVAAMSSASWQNQVTWTTGQKTPADMIARSRLAEVLIHHVDLGLGYGPASWPDAFVHNMLTRVIRSLNERKLTSLAAQLSAADTGRAFGLGGGTANDVKVSGTEADLLAWLLGRSDGAGLTRDEPGPLPSFPSLYLT